MDQIRASIKVCFDSTFDILNPNNRVHTFELFGFDFMLDENYKAWLLECNSGPSLSESNPFLSSLISRMLDDLFKITVDRVFPAPKKGFELGTKSPFPLLDYPDDDNLWYESF